MENQLKVTGLSEIQTAKILDILSKSSHIPVRYELNGSVHTVQPTESLIPYFIPDKRVFPRLRPAKLDLKEIIPSYHSIKSSSVVGGVPSNKVFLLSAPFITMWERTGAIKLRKYQEYTARRIREIALAHRAGAPQKGLYLQDYPGLGKTAQYIESMLQVYDYIKFDLPTLVIVPKTTKGQIRAEFKKYVKIKTAPIWDEDFANEKRVIIIHYEDFRMNVEEYQAIKWGCVIFDEAHRLRNRDTQLYRALKSFSVHAKVGIYIFASATPWHRNPAEMWGVLNVIDPVHFSSYHRFEETHTKFDGAFARGVINAAALAEEIAPYTLLRTYLEVAPELPELIETIVPIDFLSPQKVAYKKIQEGDFINYDGFTEIKIPNVLAAIVRRQQITSYPPILKSNAESAKMEWIMDFAEDRMEDGEQFIIFCKFRETCQMVQQRLIKLGIKTARFEGGMKQQDIDSISKRIDAGEIQALVSIFETGGTGLSFPKIPFAIAYDMHWSTIQFFQAKYRIQRINITRQKQMFYLTIPGTVDTLILNAVLGNWNEQRLCKEFLIHQDEY